MEPRTRRAIVGRLSDFERLVEVGVGRRTEVAVALARAGHEVTATDLDSRKLSETVDSGEVESGSVEFVADDVLDPDLAVYRDADAVYALNLPPELHRPVMAVARDADTAFLFTTLGNDQPAVPVGRETVPGETIFVARE